MSYDVLLQQQIRRRLGIERKNGVIGDANGAVDVPNNPGYVYVREYQSDNSLGAPKELPLSAVLQPTPDLPVIIGFDIHDRWAVIGLDSPTFVSTGGNPATHNPAHPAVYNATSQAELLPLSVRPLSSNGFSTTEVSVRALIQYRDGAFEFYPGERVELSSMIPSVGLHRYVVVWLKTDMTIELTGSTAQSILDPLDFSDLQECATASAGSIPAHYYLLRGDTTAITASTPGDDIRPMINVTDSTGGGYAPVDATYIVQTPSADLTNEQALSALSTGVMISTTATGVVTTVSAPTGAIVGDTDTQTLTNKTLTAPTIADFTNANHDHLDADDGGTLDAAAIASGTFNAARIPNLPASIITSGQLALARGGTNADLSATGGTAQVLKQLSAGANITVAALADTEIPNLPASKITSGQLALARGGTNADLSATGGANQVLKQSSSGAAITVATLSTSDIPTLTSAKISDLAWVFLDEDVLGSSVASIELDLSAFSAYDHFKIIWKGRTDRAAQNFDDLLIRMNNDTATSSYAGTGTAFSTGTAYQEILISTAGITGVPVYLGNIGAGASAGRFTYIEITIYFAQITTLRMVSYTGGASAGTTTAVSGHLSGMGYWTGSAALTELDLLPRAGSNFVTGTSYTLLGCKT